MWSSIFWALAIYSAGLITGPLVLFVFFKLALRVLRRAQRR
jgi:hypothetical protein